MPPAVSSMQRRFLNLHEYQAQKIFQEHGVAVPKNSAVFSVSEAVEKCKELFTVAFPSFRVAVGGGELIPSSALPFPPWWVVSVLGPPLSRSPTTKGGSTVEA